MKGMVDGMMILRSISALKPHDLNYRSYYAHN
jgi:hypothetical protein